MNSINFAKKIFPRKFLFIGANLLHPIYYYYYLSKFKTLIIRKGSTDKHIFRQIFISNDCRLPAGINIKPKLIIDGGANVGYSSLWFMNKYPDAKIMAIEPEESNYRVLVKNSKRWKNVVPIKAGMWHKNAFLKIVDDGTGEWGFRTEEVGSSRNASLKGITVDEILKQSGCDRIDILKIDIEGAEKELFSKDYSWIDKVDVLIIELHDRLKAGCSKSFYSAIDKRDWNIYGNEANLVFVRKKAG